MCEHTDVAARDAPSRCFGSLVPIAYPRQGWAARSAATSTDVRAMQRIALVHGHVCSALHQPSRVCLQVVTGTSGKVHSALGSLSVAHGQALLQACHHDCQALDAV